MDDGQAIFEAMAKPTRPPRPLLISVVGRHNAGKTTIGTALVRRWTESGLRVAVLKHHGMHAGGVPGASNASDDWEKPDSDTRRYAASGARCTVIAGQAQTLWRLTDDPDADNPEALLRRLLQACDAVGNPLDVVLVEGFRTSALAKIVVIRDAGDAAWLDDDTLVNVRALVALTDEAASCLAGSAWRVYHSTDIGQLCADLIVDFLESRILG